MIHRLIPNELCGYLWCAGIRYDLSMDPWEADIYSNTNFSTTKTRWENLVLDVGQHGPMNMGVLVHLLISLAVLWNCFKFPVDFLKV
jgi:hypothetical protein